MTASARILVTGASGFLGREIAALLRAAGHTVTPQGFRRAHGARVCDLREPAQVAALVREAAPDWIIHASAYREPDFCEANPGEARRLNTGATQSLMDALPPGSRMMFISTDYVFDGDRPPYREDAPVCPVNVYGQTKADSEAIVLRDPASLVVRIPVLIGPDPEGVRGFVTQIVDDLRSPVPREVDGVLVRCPTSTADVARAVRFLLERGEPGVWHVAAPHAATRYALTLEAAARLGLSTTHLRPTSAVVPRLARRPINSLLDTGRLRAAGFTGMRPFADILPELAAKI